MKPEKRTQKRPARAIPGHLWYPMTMDRKQLEKVLRAHKTWVTSDGRQGQRANLHGADLSGADLSEANLSEADLT